MAGTYTFLLITAFLAVSDDSDMAMWVPPALALCGVVVWATELCDAWLWPDQSRRDTDKKRKGSRKKRKGSRKKRKGSLKGLAAFLAKYTTGRLTFRAAGMTRNDIEFFQKTCKDWRTDIDQSSGPIAFLIDGDKPSEDICAPSFANAVRLIALELIAQGRDVVLLTVGFQRTRYPPAAPRRLAEVYDGIPVYSFIIEAGEAQTMESQVPDKLRDACVNAFGSNTSLDNQETNFWYVMLALAVVQSLRKTGTPCQPLYMLPAANYGRCKRYRTALTLCETPPSTPAGMVTSLEVDHFPLDCKGCGHTRPGHCVIDSFRLCESCTEDHYVCANCGERQENPIQDLCDLGYVCGSCPPAGIFC